MTRLSKEELRNKIEWEGGITAAMEYGIRPEQVPVEIEESWREISNALAAHGYVIEAFLEEEF